MIKEIINQVIAKLFEDTKIKLEYKKYESVLNFDALYGQDWKVPSVEGDCTIHLVNTKDGDSGLIELVIDSTGGYTITFGNEFTKRISDAIDTTASNDIFISWQRIGDDIIYSISTVQ